MNFTPLARFTLLMGGILLAPLTISAAPATPQAMVSGATSSFSSNPYWPMARRSVSTILQLPEAQLSGPNSATNLFWLSWALTSPQSQIQDRPAVLTKCVALWDTVASRYTQKKPTESFEGGGFWNYMPLLESLRNLDAVPEIDTAKKAAWKAALLPHVEHEYESYGKAADLNWATSAAGDYPNADAQYLAVAYAAYLLYKDEKFKASASKFVGLMEKNLRAPGAWLYYRGSTPIPLYHGFEIIFLGRYYQLSRDPAAADQIRRTKDFYPYTYAPEDTVEYTSSPWWKQMWNPTGGPYHSPELVALLTGDPQNRWFADLRGKRYFQHFWIAWCGEAWDEAQAKADKNITAQPFPDNYVIADASINGLRGRSGKFSWMGGRGKNIIGFGGVLLAEGTLPSGYDGYLQFAHLGITVPGKEGKAYYDGLRLIADPTAIPTTGAEFVSKEHGALAVSYIPRLQTRPEAVHDDWKVTELWFFTGKGVVASFQATALKDNPGTLPQGLMRFGPVERPHAIDGKNFNVGGLQGRILQSDFPKIEMQDGLGDQHSKVQRIDLRQSLEATPNITKDQKFGYSVLFTPDAQVTAETERTSDNTLKVRLNGIAYELSYDGANQLTVTRN